MEHLCEILQDFIINDLGAYLDEKATTDCPLPHFTEKNCVLDAIDFSKYQMNQTCFILPDIQTLNELTINEDEGNTTFDIFVFCSGKPSNVLYKQVLRYGAAIKNLFKENYSINGEVTQANVTQFEFFEDVGANDKRMMGVKLSLTLLTEE